MRRATTAEVGAVSDLYPEVFTRRAAGAGMYTTTALASRCGGPSAGSPWLLRCRCLGLDVLAARMQTLANPAATVYRGVVRSAALAQARVMRARADKGVEGVVLVLWWGVRI